ncbi:hypothetical protein J7E99_07455 [Streptomyces sp. ISL-44]|uniref:hypothetical protein n=1 Tax=Streptomyces sp. ISL-44 TaxID=2819184 RepID=UPI001BEAFC0C|nr:hypothetical protein [Streptomyces sp. ISL-44]MBT2540542.1 hypothetical protein [Streptomyces sp. ISL-44]
MLINPASAAHLDDATPWNDLYKQAAEEQNDLVSEVRTAVEYGMHDPEDSVEMACTAAETAETTVQALSSPWSLYTPQDAATVASALFVQLQSSADALQELGRAVGRIVERGEAELVAPAGAGQPANLGDALQSLRSVSDTLHDLVARHASTTVRALHAAPRSAPVPADAHETVVAVAALLTNQHDGAVTLTSVHEDGEYDPEDDSGFVCGCYVTILADGEEYNFGRGDSEWSLHKESDGHELPDGSMVFDRWKTLGTSLKTAHPQQLADDVLRVIKADCD